MTTVRLEVMACAEDSQRFDNIFKICSAHALLSIRKVRLQYHILLHSVPLCIHANSAKPCGALRQTWQTEWKSNAPTPVLRIMLRFPAFPKHTGFTWKHGTFGALVWLHTTGGASHGSWETPRWHIASPGSHSLRGDT